MLPISHYRSVDERRASGPKDFLDIHLRIRDLQVNLGASDSFICIFYESEGGAQGPWKMCTATDVLAKVRSHDLLNAFSVEYEFDQFQQIKLETCDYTEETASVLGYTTFTVAELVASNKEPITRKVINEETGDFVAHALISCAPRARATPVLVQFLARSISKKSVGENGTIMFQVYRIENNDDRMLLYRSEPTKNGSKVLWRHFTLQRGDIADTIDRQIEVVCYCRDDKGKRSVIGQFQTEYSALINGSSIQNLYHLINGVKGNKKSCGTFEVVRCADVTMYTFLDYVISGANVHFAVAIDFSCSETDSEQPAIRNFYEDVEFVVRTLGQQFHEYDPSNQYAAFGLGAKIPPLYRESQEFCLSLETDPNCRGLDGILNAFTTALSSVKPMSNAHFAHVIYYVSKLAQHSHSRGNTGRPQYYVLTIITKGCIKDLKETIQAIIFASRAPISVIFVGVGNGPFSDLERLGSAGSRLAFQGRKAERDVVQFASVNAQTISDVGIEEFKSVFREQALAQIPWQMATWMMKNGVVPNSAKGSTTMMYHPSTAPTQRRRLQQRSGSFDTNSENEDSYGSFGGMSAEFEFRPGSANSELQRIISDSETLSISSCPTAKRMPSSGSLYEESDRRRSQPSVPPGLGGLRSFSIQASSSSGSFVGSAFRQRRSRMLID
uniref:Copine domain-containing protein n=1 Tax=Steinernema glaseri TaxID=37863 RepID=A0A1I7ZDH7_9BILA